MSSETLYCRCGSPLTVEYHRTGIKTLTNFRNTDGRTIDHCPGCGEWLYGAWKDGQLTQEQESSP